MKKFLCFILVFILAVFSPCASYAGIASGYGAPNGLTGGCDGCLDAIDGSSLVVGSFAFASNGTMIWIYTLKEDGATENSPYVISPDTNAGNKRWHVLQIGPLDIGGY
jgi:hypothetical protein